MSDERLAPPRGRIDDAIDRTILELVHREAPSAIRERVLALLARRAEPPASSPWFQSRRLAWGTAAVVIVVGFALVSLRWWERHDLSGPLTLTDVASESPAQPPVATDTGRVPTAGLVESAPAGASAGRPLGRRLRVTESLGERTERPALIDPLSAPDPIVISALETERVTAEGVDIEPMSLEPLRIEPIHEPR